MTTPELVWIIRDTEDPFMNHEKINWACIQRLRTVAGNVGASGEIIQALLRIIGDVLLDDQ